MSVIRNAPHYIASSNTSSFGCRPYELPSWAVVAALRISARRTSRLAGWLARIGVGSASPRRDEGYGASSRRIHSARDTVSRDTSCSAAEVPRRGAGCCARIPRGTLTQELRDERLRAAALRRYLAQLERELEDARQPSAVPAYVLAVLFGGAVGGAFALGELLLARLGWLS